MKVYVFYAEFEGKQEIQGIFTKLKGMKKKIDKYVYLTAKELNICITRKEFKQKLKYQMTELYTSGKTQILDIFFKIEIAFVDKMFKRSFFGREKESPRPKKVKKEMKVYPKQSPSKLNEKIPYLRLSPYYNK